MGFAFWGTNPNLNWAVNRLNQQHSILYNLLEAAQKAIEQNQTDIGNQAASGSATATHEIVEKAVQWAVNKATSQRITYSQDPVLRHLKVPNATSYDCSSFIITAFYAVGLDIPRAQYTGNMVPTFEAVGFKYITGTTWQANQLQRGDILINTANHTQMYIGNNQDVNCGSTPAKVMKHNINNYGRGWTGILRYEGNL